MDAKSFLPPLILEIDREKPWLEWVEGAVLFADVSGFTPMAEALSVQGAEGGEVLTDVLNRYFAVMIGIVGAHGGQVMKFGGDAILCFFPESSLSRKGRQAVGGRLQEEAKPPNLELKTWNREPGGVMSGASSLPRALRAARLMQDVMPRFHDIKTPVKRFALKMKIGVAHGECLLAGVGNPAVRCDYVFAGAPVDATSDAEHHAVAGEIIFAGDESKVQSQKFKVEEIEAGFWRILGASSRLETRNSKLETGSSPRATGCGLRAAVSPYLIPEVHEMVSKGYASQVGALLPIVPAFMQFAGFRYDRDGFDLNVFHRFFVDVMAITQQYEGRLNRISMGDKGSTFLVLFGAPKIVEKKEELASQWAMDVQRLAADQYPGVAIRMGLNSGRVFCGIVGGSGRWEYTVMGDAVNFGARLMQGAQPDQVCASRAFSEPASAAFAFEDMGKRKFKGKAEPLAVFALKERRRAGLTAGAAEQSVGREKETQELLDWLDAADQGTPGMAVIEGDPGVGKSFLAARFLQESAERGWRTIAAKGEITRRSYTYDPWKDLFRKLLFSGMDPDLPMLEAALLDDQKPVLPWFAEFFELPLPEGMETPKNDEETKKRLFQHHLSRLLLSRVPGPLPGSEGELSTLNSQLSTDADRLEPVCIFLDDLHWFDTLSLELLKALLDHLKEQRFFILAAARPGWEKGDFEDRAACHFLSLVEMDKDTVRGLIESVLGGNARADLVSFVYDRTRGNPFFAIQLVDYLKNCGFLEMRLGEWTVAREAESKGILSGEGIITAQLEKLTPEQKVHLAMASCMGPTFSEEILREAMGRGFRGSSVEALLRMGYFVPAEAGWWTFPHALVQETLYQAIPLRTRRHHHGRIGRSMEKVLAKDLERYSPNLAEHFSLAGIRPKALEYAVRAGTMLHRQQSYPEARKHLAKAWDLLKRSSRPQKWEVGLLLGWAYMRSGHLNESVLLSRRLLKLIRRTERSEKVINKIFILQLDAMQRLGKYSYISRAIKQIRSMKKQYAPQIAVIRQLIGIAWYRKGNFKKAEQCFWKVIEIECTSDIKDAMISSFIFMASMEKSKGKFDSALICIEKSLAICRQEHDIYQEMRSNIEKANIFIEAGQFNGARNLLLDTMHKSEEMGDYYLYANACFNLGLLAQRRGDYDQTKKHLIEVSVLLLKQGALGGYALAQLQLGANFFFQGEFIEAYLCYVKAIEIFERSSELTNACHCYFSLTEVCIELGKFEEARHWYRKGVQSFKEDDSPSLASMFRDLKAKIDTSQ